MPNYENYKCPVCHRQFEKNDDIVTCPECGTPHHRECYKLVGHCVNEGLHKNDYSFLDAEKPKKKEIEQIFYSPSENENEQGEDIINEAKANTVQDAQKDESDKKEQASQGGFSQFQTIQLDIGQYPEKGEIDGVSIADIAATVRNNAPRFISKFKQFSEKKKKLSWNWSAFFFGSFYLLFRKMYKQGIAFFCLVITAIIGGEAAIMKFAPKYIEAMQSFINGYDTSKAVTTADLQSIMAAPDSMTAVKIAYIILGVILVLRIIQALFADYFYKTTVFSIIKSVTDKLDNGANFTQTYIFFGQDEQLDQNQMKALYLSNKGGVSFFAPFTAYFAFYILMMFI